MIFMKLKEKYLRTIYVNKNKGTFHYRENYLVYSFTPVHKKWAGVFLLYTIYINNLRFVNQYI